MNAEQIANQIVCNHWKNPTMALLGLHDAIKRAVEQSKPPEYADKIMAMYRRTDWKIFSGERALHSEIRAHLTQIAPTWLNVQA